MADSKDKANAELKRAQRVAEGKSAMADYEAQAAAVREKMARLKALRLARDAAMPPPPPRKAPATKKKSAAKSTKGPAPKLAEWLEDQKKGGRNS